MSTMRRRLGRALRATLAAGVTCAVLGAPVLALARPSAPGTVNGAPQSPVGGTVRGPGTAVGPAGQAGLSPGGTGGAGAGAKAQRGPGGAGPGGNGGAGAPPSRFGRGGFGLRRPPCGPPIAGGVCGGAIVPAPQTGPLSLSGYVVGLSPGYLMLQEAGRTVLNLALSPAVSVIDQGLPGSLADVGTGDGVLVTLNRLNEVALIDITSLPPAAAVPAPAIP